MNPPYTAKISVGIRASLLYTFSNRISFRFLWSFSFIFLGWTSNFKKIQRAFLLSNKYNNSKSLKFEQISWTGIIKIARPLDHKVKAKQFCYNLLWVQPGTSLVLESPSFKCGRIETILYITKYDDYHIKITTTYLKLKFILKAISIKIQIVEISH